MSTSAFHIIIQEHQALAAVLHALRHAVAEVSQGREKPDFEVLRSLLFYIDAFPERLHHPKESQHLFPKLRGADARLAAILDRLESDHARGERAILDLQHQLLECEMLGGSRFSAFASAVDQFCDHYMEHMRIEEEEVLPAARQRLTDEDWAAIDREFQINRDPLTGHAPEREFEALFSRIVSLVPAPLGLGRIG